jgi:hypothetical protein
MQQGALLRITDPILARANLQREGYTRVTDPSDGVLKGEASRITCSFEPFSTFARSSDIVCDKSWKEVEQCE